MTDEVSPQTTEPTEPGEPTELVAWRDLCRRMEALGAGLLAEGYPTDADERAEGFAHLAEQVVCWLAWNVGHADARHPAFHRQNDLVTQWGGPNNDNVYRHARVDPALRYRIAGRMHGCDDFVLAVRAGFMHEPRWGTLLEVTASEMGIRRGGDFELVLGRGDAIDLPEGAAMVSIREYYLDWQADEPAMFTIECLDEDGPAARVTAEELSARFAATAASVEHSMSYWKDYLLDARAGGVDNTFAPSQRVAKGLALARYAFCFWRLDPDEALVVEVDVPAARYWSLQLYTMGWFEPIDAPGRVTSRNHLQTTVGAGGRVRSVVAHTDPGVDNWLDTGGRREGLLILRWFWPNGEGAPTPSATVVPVAAIAHDPGVTTDARARERDARRRQLAWRFRT
jgi:hypothetical protein